MPVKVGSVMHVLNHLMVGAKDLPELRGRIAGGKEHERLLHFLVLFMLFFELLLQPLRPLAALATRLGVLLAGMLHRRS